VMRLIPAEYAVGKDIEAARKLSAVTVDNYRSSMGSATALIDISIESMAGKHYERSTSVSEN